MEFCDLTIRTALKNRISEQLKDLGYIEGKLYPLEKLLMNDESELKKLNRLQAYYPGVRVYDLGEETIKIEITITDDAINEFKKETPEDDYSSLSTDNLEAIFNERRPKFEKFVEETRLALEQLTKIEKVKTQIFENVPTATMTRLWNLKRELDKKGDWSGLVKGLVGYLLENRDIIEVAANKITAMDQNDPLVFPKMKELMHLINASRHIFEDINSFFNLYAPNNPLNQLVEDGLKDIKRADQRMLDTAREYAIDILGKDYQTKYNELKAEFDSYVRAQESLRTSDPNRNAVIDKNIQKARESFEKNAPSLERLNQVLTGAEGDASWFYTYLNAGMANPDLVVAGFMNKIKEAYRGVNQVVVDFQNELKEVHDQYLKDTNKTDTNPDELFKDFIEPVTIWYYDYEKKAFDTITEMHLVHDVDPNYYTERSRIKAEFDKLREDFINGTEEERVQLEVVRKELERKQRELERATQSKPYTDEYYEVFDMLEEEVGGRTIREIRRPYQEQIDGIKRQIRLQNNIPTPDDIEALDEVYRELQSLRSTVNKTGDDLRIAQILQAYHARRNEMVRYHISDRKREQFHIQRKDIENKRRKNQITKDEYDRWLKLNTTTVFSDEFNNRTNTIFRQLNRIADQIAALQNREPEKGASEAWAELRANVRAFRDHNNVINGTIMTPEQVADAKRLEEIIEQIKKDSVNFRGLTAQQRAEKQTLYDEISYLQGQKEIAYADGDKVAAKDLQDQITALFDEIKSIDDSVIDTPQLKTLVASYENYMKELAELRETTHTKYYEEEFNRQLSLWMDQNSAVMPPREFRYTGFHYKILDNGNVEVDGVERSDIDVEGVWRLAQVNRFQSSQWFQDNHIQKEVFEDKVRTVKMVPIYIWRQSKPKDPRHILSEEPNFNWTETEVLDKYKNQDFELDVTEKPKVINRPNPKYQSMDPRDRQYLDYLTKIYHEAQDAYTPNQRLGYRIPSIEREFSVVGAFQTDIGTTKQQIKRKFVSHEQDSDAELGDTSNRKAQFIPVYFKGRIDSNLVSKNLIHSLIQYKGQAIKYENLEKVEPLAEAIEETLNKYPPASGKAHALARKLGIQKQTFKRGQNIRLDAVRQMTDMFIYGEWKKEEKIAGVRVDKVFDKMLGLRSYFMLAGSSFSQLANIGNGAFNQIIKASVQSGKANFTLKQWGKAYRDLTFKYSSELMHDRYRIGHKSYLGQMLDIFDVFDGQFMSIAGTEIENKGTVRYLMNSNLPFFFKNIAEYTLNVTTFIAFAHNYMVNVNGIRTPLIKAFEIRNGRLTPKFELTPEIRNDISSKVTLLNRDINGNYGKLDQTLVERFWLGRAIFWMKKFFLPMALARWGAERYSYEENRIIEGYHRSAIKTFFSAARELFTDPRNMSMFWDTRTEHQKESVKRTIVEFMLLTAIWIMLEGVLGFDDDDTKRWKKAEKRSWFYRAILASMIKLQSEAETFIVPLGGDELIRIQKNFLQEVVPMFADLWKILYRDWHPINEWGEKGPLVQYKRDYRQHEKGDYKIISDIAKLFGLTWSKIDPIYAAQNIELSKLR